MVIFLRTYIKKSNIFVWEVRPDQPVLATSVANTNNSLLIDTVLWMLFQIWGKLLWVLL